jgi:hypothetical protein
MNFFFSMLWPARFKFSKNWPSSNFELPIPAIYYNHRLLVTHNSYYTLLVTYFITTHSYIEKYYYKQLNNSRLY